MLLCYQVGCDKMVKIDVYYSRFLHVRIAAFMSSMTRSRVLTYRIKTSKTKVGNYVLVIITKTGFIIRLNVLNF